MTQLNLLLLLMVLMCSVDTFLPPPSDPPESVPRREDFVSLTWYRTTAHRRLHLSDDNRTATLLGETETYPIHHYCPQSTQVLGSTPLTGRCYFEVLWNDWVDISLAHKPTTNTDRRRTLQVYNNGEIGQRTAGIISGVVGVFLDYDAGMLSFYEIMDEGRASHLYTFRETFTQPLFPGFGVWVVYAQRSVGNSGTLLSSPRISP
uniref:SPRY domain-containing protein n=1 Tax=Knipowitschia caucasica TaxID=637954 RepID=A0AAV2KM78_KNICA